MDEDVTVTLTGVSVVDDGVTLTDEIGEVGIMIHVVLTTVLFLFSPEPEPELSQFPYVPTKINIIIKTKPKSTSAAVYILFYQIQLLYSLLQVSTTSSQALTVDTAYQHQQVNQTCVFSTHIVYKFSS